MEDRDYGQSSFKTEAVERKPEYDLCDPSQALVHLHVHTEHSLLDGIPKVSDLVDRVESLGQWAVAITDHGEMSGHLRLQRECDKRGIKPVFGMEGYFCDDRFEKTGKKGELYQHMTLLAVNKQGLENLWALGSLAEIEGKWYGDPRFDWELLEKYSEGLVATGGCMGGCVARFFHREGRHYNPERGYERLGRFLEIFGDRFYLEIHSFDSQEHRQLNRDLVQLSSEFSVPLIGVSDTHYAHPDDWKEHEVLTAIQMGRTMNSEDRFSYGPNQLAIISESEWRDRLDYLPQSVVDECIQNTSDIAKMSDVTIEEDRRMPVFFENVDVDVMELKKKAWEGFERKVTRLQGQPGIPPIEEYRERLEYELSIVIPKGFAGYFLYVHDIVSWAKADGQLVGPARGSAGGSLLAYVLDITEVEPMRAGLIFERFLDPGRESMPDIDIDFPPIERVRTTEYLKRKYGEFSIANIGTLNTLKPKAALRDFCRGLEIPREDAKAMGDLIEETGLSGAPSWEWEEVQRRYGEQFAPWVEKYPYLFELMSKFSSNIRHTGGHAGGVVISKESLIGKLPLREKNGVIRTMMDMKDVEYLGFVKIDMLGLRNLSSLMQVMRLIEKVEDKLKEQGREVPPHPYEWQYDWEKYYGDEKTWDQICSGKNIGCFQIETTGLRSLVKRMQPRSLQDLTDMISVFRPGITRAMTQICPRCDSSVRQENSKWTCTSCDWVATPGTEEPVEINLMELYLQRREGKRHVRYKHPLLEQVVGGTYGSFIYQEQIMRCCAVLAGYSLSETDRVRRIMGKMLYDEMQKERVIFVEGCKKNGIDEYTANSIFDDMASFGTYGYNLAHGWAYAMVAYWCAYYKAHFPREFMTSLFQTNERNAVLYTRECRRMGIRVLGPEVNESDASFTLTEGGTIRYGLGRLKYMANGALEVAEHRPFKSMSEFVERVPRKKVSKRAVLAAILCGAFDSIAGNDGWKERYEGKSATWIALDEYWEARGDWKRRHDTCADLQADPKFDCEKNGIKSFSANRTWFDEYCDELDVDARIVHEKEYLGTLVGVDPLADFMGLIQSEETYPGMDQMLLGEVCRLGGMINYVRPLVTKRGKNPGQPMAQIWIEPAMTTQIEAVEEDEEGQATGGDESLQIVVFPDVYAKYQDQIADGAPVLVDVEKLNGGLSLRRLFRLDKLGAE